MTPIELTYEKRVYKTDRPLESIEYGSEPSSSHEFNIGNEQGLTAADFLESTETDGSGVVLIPQIRFDNNRYVIRIDEDDVLVKRTNCVRYHKGKPRGEPKTLDPLSIVVSLREVPDGSDVDTDYARSVAIHLRSDVWVKNTEAGKVNRAYLGEFLEQVASAISAEAVSRERYDYSDFWYDLSLGTPDEIGFDMESIY
ncbi:hypothetical protein NDI56_16645 [Haloarcula sp. S1CR25-12]|uniref:Uncharacterized protein n=1 Tax=Haloarcula saliterrae TaxID=2950534 RepID=A0ABU2FFJ3_9EURY|nr:hypothetical protein [Haloarcula sp. S1CR25-12]MDS0261030.1 hypothetical protein [Haloarcula sp. S1CR25-12]